MQALIFISLSLIIILFVIYLGVSAVQKGLKSKKDIDDIKEDSEVILILHLRGLKFLKQHFYCDCYISQIKLCENTAFFIPDECLIEDEIYEFEVVDEEILQKNKLREELQKEYSKKLDNRFFASIKNYSENNNDVYVSTKKSNENKSVNTNILVLIFSCNVHNF